MQEAIQNYLGGIPDKFMRLGFSFERRESTLNSDDYLEELAFYSQDKFQKEKLFFDLPSKSTSMELEGEKDFCDGKQTLLKYDSRYTPANQRVNHRYFSHMRNQKGYLLTWTHPDNQKKKRPMVLCVHGFHMGQPQRAKAMFKVKKLYEMGMDVSLFIQPHHWRRAENPIKQYFINSEDIPLTIETFGQALHDLHSCYLYLKDQGYNRIGLIGGSLGGAVISLYASLTDDPEFIFSVVPAIRFDHYLNPSKAHFKFKVTAEHIKKTNSALDIIDPGFYQPQMPMERLAVVYHQGDKINEAADTKNWIRQWGVKNSTSIAGGHWVVFDKKARGKAWYGWLKDHNFTENF